VVGLELADELEVFDAAITGELGGPTDVTAVELHGCTLTDVRLGGRVIERLRLVDVVLQGCDLSGVVLPDASWTRVELRDCRLSGAVLSGVRAQDVRWTGCRADSAVLRMSHWKGCWFEDTDLRGADFYDASLPDTQLLRCDLSRATFSQSNLAGSRLHGSTLDGVIGGEAFRGTRISSAQVLPLAMSVLGALDIVVED
jgi:uncharacterized protein YjbI with pentapeptide repeats